MSGGPLLSGKSASGDLGSERATAQNKETRVPRKPSERKDSQSVEVSISGYHLTSGDIARLLHVDLKTIHNWVNQGHLTGRRTKGRHLRFERTEIVRFMRQYGYPIPAAVGEHPPKVVLDRAEGSALMSRRTQTRGLQVSVAAGLFACSLELAAGEQEIVLIDLDQREPRLVRAFLAALRVWPLSKGVLAVGISGRRSVRRAFLAAGGDVALPTEADADVRATMAWLTGAADVCPASAELS